MHILKIHIKLRLKWEYGYELIENLNVQFRMSIWSHELYERKHRPYHLRLIFGTNVGCVHIQCVYRVLALSWTIPLSVRAVYPSVFMVKIVKIVKTEKMVYAPDLSVG